MRVATFASLTCIATFTSTICGQSTQPSTDNLASIASKVLDSSAEPRQAEINAYSLKIRDGGPELFLVCTAQADQDGSFQCPTIQTGTYFAAVRPQMLTAGPSTKAKAKSTVPAPRFFFYGGSSDFEADQPVHLTPWQDSLVRHSSPRTIRRTVTGAAVSLPSEITDFLEAAPVRLHLTRAEGKCI